MVVNIVCVCMGEALSASTDGALAAVLGPRLGTKTLLWLNLTPLAAPSAMTALCAQQTAGADVKGTLVIRFRNLGARGRQG
jgi:hypothetical protein